MDYQEFTIRKKSGKLRKIVAPDDELKKFQRKQLRELSYKFQMTAGELFSHYHGFIEDRNCITAATEHIGYEATVMFDLSNFFDTVTYKHVKEAGVELSESQTTYLFHREGYAAQGFPTSPTLANIALIPAVKMIVLNLDILLGENNYAFTIYADDIQISYNSTERRVQSEISRVVKRACSQYGFTINPNKTRVRFTKYGARRVLGVNVYESHIQATRKTNRKVRAVAKLTEYDPQKGHALGGLRGWQQCRLPKNLQGQIQL